MRSEVIWSPTAEQDLESILDYLQHKWSNRIINKFINKVDANISVILEDPKIFPIINEKLKIRKSVITKQKVFTY